MDRRCTARKKLTFRNLLVGVRGPGGVQSGIMAFRDEVLGCCQESRNFSGRNQNRNATSNFQSSSNWRCCIFYINDYDFGDSGVLGSR